MKHGGQQNTNKAQRYELRTSQRGIDMRQWRDAVRATGVASSVTGVVCGNATVITFDTTDPRTIRDQVRVSMNTENFSLRMVRRLPFLEQP